MIGILAAITIVSYNGITQRANNAQTIEAVRQWVEALETYDAEHDGDWSAVPIEADPVSGSTMVCLGEGYPYGSDGHGSSGGQCVGTSEFGVQESTVLNNALRGHFDGGIPTPSFQTAKALEGEGEFWMRGAFFFGDSPYIGFVVMGVNECPKIGNAISHEYGSEESLSETLFGNLEIENGLVCAVRFNAF